MALILLGVALLLALTADRAARRGDALFGIVFSASALLLALITALALVPRLARRVNFSRWLMPLSFSITREGGVYILAIFLLSLAAINTGNNLLFLILAAMLAAIITSGIVARNSLQSIIVTMQVPENVFEGEPVSIKVSLRNLKRYFPSFSISVEALGNGGPRLFPLDFRKLAFWRTPPPVAAKEISRTVLRHPAYFPLVRPGEVRSELVIQSFPKRGLYQLDSYRLSTRFPFGFFRRGERVRASGQVLVYPAIHEISPYFHLLPFLPGRLEGPHVGQGESLFCIRKYQEGESARLVDWKATAKTGVLMAREFAREEENKFCLILDTLIHAPARPAYKEEFEKAVSLAASLAAHFSDEGTELEFLTPHEHVPRGIGTDHLYRIMRSLAVVDCRLATDQTSNDLREGLSGIMELEELQLILSAKIFKVIITSKPKGSFPATLWRSSHVVYFDEL